MSKNSSGRPPSQRQLRVGEIVRHALTQLLQRSEVPDELIEKTVLSICEVSMSPDLKKQLLLSLHSVSRMQSL